MDIKKRVTRKKAGQEVGHTRTVYHSHKATEYATFFSRAAAVLAGSGHIVGRL